MSTTKALDPAFQGAGSRPGTEIWRIENFQPVPLPKSEHGKFYMGDSYIVMQTTSGRGGAYQYDLHFWLGKDTSQDESGTAAIKTVELDASLGGKAVQHREVQGHESDKFLSYFKPCIIPLEGGVASGFKTPEEDEFETRLYICKGKRVVKVKQVPFSRASLNHDDVFILDTKDKIYQFNGANSNIQERAKALEVTQFLKDTYHGGVCNIAIVDDGKLQAETDSGEFWVCFGGFAPIGRKVVSDDDVIPDATPAKLFSVADGKLEPMEGELSKGALENHKCYILDCGNEIYTWFGRATQVDERKSASQAAEDLVTSHGRPKATYITRVIQGYESQSFKSYFESWPMGSNAGAEEGRGKVAAFWKQQGGTKGATKGDAAEEVPPLLEVGVKIEVWRVDGNQKTSIAKEDIGKFYSGDCYIVLYTYHSGDKKEDFYLCWWVGKDSVEEEQKAACQLSSAMFNKLKERPVLGRIYQGKEPSQFIALFQPMIVLKGGLSSGYKSSVEAKGSKDETYAADGVALFRISGTASHNNKVIQVDPVAASLNTYECCVLQTANAVFAWQGTQSLVEQQQLGVKVAEILKPGGPLKYAKEGTETQVFWSALGGKNTFDSKKTSQNTVRDPHLYAFTVVKGKFQVEEIYNFAQDDLLTEDILMLDTHAEVFVWVGQAVDPKEKQHTFEMGENYVELATTTDGLSPQVPLYKLIEGHEPCFFTSYFPSWDAARANVQGNSFQKKATLMFGSNSTERSSQGGGQRAAAMAALSGSLTAEKKPGSPAHSSASQRAAAMAALSGSGAADKKPASPSAHEEHQEEAEPTAEEEENAFEGAIEGTYSYDQLKAKSENPVTGIDFKRREAYLTDEDFEKVFGMLKEDFYKMPRWKQDTQKKKLDLF